MKKPQRTTIIPVRYSDEEKQAIDKARRKLGLTRGAFIRAAPLKVALGYDSLHEQPPEKQ